MARKRACPSCGAPLQLGRGPVECAFCGAAVEPGSGLQPPEGALGGPVGGGGPAVPPGRRAGCAVPLVVLLMVVAAGAGFAVLRLGSGDGGGVAGVGGRRLHPTAAAVPVPTDRAGPPDLAVVANTYRGTDSQVEVLYLEGPGGRLRWSVPVERDQGGQALVAADATAVYVAELDGTLRALSRDRGEVRWTATVPSAPPAGCPACLQVVGARAVVLGRDGSVAAFDTAGGGQAWNARLADSPRQLVPVAGGVAVLSRVAEPSQTAVVVFDAETGERRQVAPECRDPSQSVARIAHRPSISDPLLPVDGGRSLLVVYRCVQRLDVATLRLDELVGWSRQPGRPDFGGSVLHEEQPHHVVDGGLLLSGDRGAARSVDLTTGEVQVFELDGRYDFRPVAARGDKVVLTAAPDFDRGRAELWGVVAGRADPAWRHVMAASDEWRARAVPAGVAVVECDDRREDDKGCTFLLLDPADGRQAARDRSAGIFTAAFLRMETDHRYSYVTVGLRLFVVEHAEAKVAYAFGSR